MTVRWAVNVAFAFAALAVWVAFEFTGRELSEELRMMLVGVVAWAAPSPGRMAEGVKRNHVATLLAGLGIGTASCALLGDVWKDVRDAGLSCGSEVSATLLESVAAIFRRTAGRLDKADWGQLGDLAKERTPQAVVCTVRKFVELGAGGMSAQGVGSDPALARAQEFLSAVDTGAE